LYLARFFLVHYSLILKIVSNILKYAFYFQRHQMIEEITKICMQHLQIHFLNNTVKFISKFVLCILFACVQYMILFFFIFSKFILFYMARIWIDKSSFRNNFHLYFQTKAIKFALQLSQYYIFFAVINNYFYELPSYDTVRNLFRITKNFLKEIRSIHCLSSPKTERLCYCCKKSILNRMITSA